MIKTRARGDGAVEYFWSPDGAKWIFLAERRDRLIMVPEDVRAREDVDWSVAEYELARAIGCSSLFFVTADGREAGPLVFRPSTGAAEPAEYLTYALAAEPEEEIGGAWFSPEKRRFYVEPSGAHLLLTFAEEDAEPRIVGEDALPGDAEEAEILDLRQFSRMVVIRHAAEGGEVVSGTLAADVGDAIVRRCSPNTPSAIRLPSARLVPGVGIVPDVALELEGLRGLSKEDAMEALLRGDAPERLVERLTVPVWVAPPSSVVPEIAHAIYGVVQSERAAGALFELGGLHGIVILGPQANAVLAVGRNVGEALVAAADALDAFLRRYDTELPSLFSRDMFDSLWRESNLLREFLNDPGLVAIANAVADAD